MYINTTPVPPTFAAVAAVSGDKPLTRRDIPAPPAPMSTSKKPTPIKTQVAPTMVPATTPPATQVAGQSDMRATSKDKGKGRALPGPYIDKVPVGILSYEEDPYGYNLTFDDNKFDNNYAADYPAALMSNMVDCVAAILSGTTPTGTLQVPQEWGESQQYSTLKPLLSLGLPWMTWRLPTTRAITGRWIFWPPFIKWSQWPTNWGKCNPCSTRASPTHGRYQDGYLQHAMTNQRENTSP